MNIGQRASSKTEKSQSLSRGDWLRVLLIWIIVTLLRYGVFGVLFIVFSEGAHSQDILPRKAPFLEGEILRYKVKWGFIRLGTVIIRQEPGDSIDPKRRRVTIEAQSAEGLPFIDVYFVNEGVLSTENLSSFEFKSVVGRDKREVYVHHTDTSAKQLIVSEFECGRKRRLDTLSISELIYDDPSLFMLFRCLSGSGKTKEVSSVMESEIQKTVFRFPMEHEPIEVAAINGPVDTYRFEGKADWTRSEYAGLKGEFCGWVSADSAAVPLRIEARIFLGSIVLELESYQRPAWPANDNLLSHLKK